MIGTWNKPEEIVKEVSIVDLTDEVLYFYHDQMHIFWDKILDGVVFGSSDSITDIGPWTFNDVFYMHKETVMELFRRNLKHLSPINSLDKVPFANSKEELLDVINYISKK